MLLLYNILLFIVSLFAIPYYGLKMLFTGKYRHSLGPKFGINRPDLYQDMKGKPRVWIHAVSVGEVTAAAPIIASLQSDFPGACIVLSTSTETGQAMARRIVPASVHLIYYPLDIPFVIRKVVRQIQPDIFIPTETELWPNFLRICKRQEIKIVMINGRLSPRSFRQYYRTRFFWKQFLADIDEMGVISEIDGQRAGALGMAQTKIHVLGNSKYDGLAAMVSPALREDIAHRLNIADTDRVFVAGSTHEGEEIIILDVYKQLLNLYPDFKLILIPRHIERGQEVIRLVKQYGFRDSLTMTEINQGLSRRNQRVLVVDVIGELFKIYSLATIVFCGGSLVRKGGQNILEPAAWGKVVLYGPSMEDFRDEKTLLEEAGAGITVTDSHDLFDRILALLRDPETLTRKGQIAGQVIAANRGASQRYASLIKEVLMSKNRIS